MRQETAEQPIRLRSGYTTGACATATALVAARMLLTGEQTDHASIELPRGEIVEFALTECNWSGKDRARASTVKDAGDDPDATHGATVFAEIALTDQPGVYFHAAEGVGTITRNGLAHGIGEPAINPVPRKMISAHLAALADETDYSGGFDVHIGIVNGEKIALDTMNGRLGIVGGLSILGTTGIVRPFSCAAYIASIHQSIEVAHANGVEHIAASTGSTSENYIRARLGLDDMALVEMGDFAGAVFKHLRKAPISHISVCGGFGKITKMAAGHTSLHSQHSNVDFLLLAEWAIELGAHTELAEKIKLCNTTIEVLALCQRENIDIGKRVSQLAQGTAVTACPSGTVVDVFCVDRSGHCVGSATWTEY